MSENEVKAGLYETVPQVVEAMQFHADDPLPLRRWLEAAGRSMESGTARCLVWKPGWELETSAMDGEWLVRQGNSFVKCSPAQFEVAYRPLVG